MFTSIGCILSYGISTGYWNNWLVQGIWIRIGFLSRRSVFRSFTGCGSDRVVNKGTMNNGISEYWLVVLFEGLEITLSDQVLVIFVG
jgi:hypothetical protein